MNQKKYIYFKCDLPLFYNLQKVSTVIESYNKLEITKEGDEIARNGSYEYQIFKSIPDDGITKENLIVSLNIVIKYTI